MKDIFGREIVQQPTGQMAGFIEHKQDRSIVCEPTGPMNGFTQNGGTFDNAGRRLLSSDQPGFFFGGKKK